MKNKNNKLKTGTTTEQPKPKAQEVEKVDKSDCKNVLEYLKANG